MVLGAHINLCVLNWNKYKSGNNIVAAYFFV